MFDTFTVRSKTVINLGKTEAKRIGDDCIGTQHILYGLIKEGSGVAAHVLSNNGITATMVREEAEKITQKGNGTTDPIFSPRARTILTQAVNEATQLGHRYVGTEHILLALLTDVECQHNDNDSAAVQILKNFKLNPQQLYKETLNLLGFYDRKFFLRPTEEENIFSVFLAESDGEVVVGRYDKDTDELLFNRPLSTEEIQRVIEVIRAN